MDDRLSLSRLLSRLFSLGWCPERLDSFEWKPHPKLKPISARSKFREEKDSAPLRQIVYPPICQFCRCSPLMPNGRPAVQEQSVAQCPSSIAPVCFVVVHEVTLIEKPDRTNVLQNEHDG